MRACNATHYLINIKLEVIQVRADVVLCGAHVPGHVGNVPSRDATNGFRRLRSGSLT